MGMIQTAGIALGGLALAIPVGGVLSGLDRWLTAKLQSRKGPPIRQPFLDLVKLLAKETVVTSPLQVFSPVATLTASALALGLFASGGDMLVVLFIHTVGAVFLVLGAMTSASPYSQCSAQRELWQMLSCETMLFLIAGALYFITGSFRIDSVQLYSDPLLYRTPLLFAAFLFALTIKMRKSPFDLAGCHHAHQELVRGIYTEYSGPLLGLLEIAHWLDLVLYLAICSLFWRHDIFGMILLPMMAYLAVILLDNVSARLTWRCMLKQNWTIAFCLAALNLFLLKR